MTFPRLYARTRRFTLGVPHSFRIAPDGGRVLFLRSPAGDDPNTCLWSLDVYSGAEHVVADPRTLADFGDVPAEEKARRERSRQTAGGIVGFACDAELRHAVFALSGQVYLVDLNTDDPPAVLASAGSAIDPKLDPTGERVAYVSAGSLHVHDVATGDDRVISEPDALDVTWGVAEFIAAEEMDRHTGYWWSPDGEALLVSRVDESNVAQRFISDPANPDKPPVAIRYPAAGTDNAAVTLWLADLNGGRTKVAWDNRAFEYLVTTGWADQRPYAVVQSRDQRTLRMLDIDAETGETAVVRESVDSDWVHILPGVPAFVESDTARSTMVWTVDSADTRRLVVGDDVVTPPGLQVDRVLDVDGDTVLFAATREPTELHVWQYGPGGLARVTEDRGVYGGRRSGGTTVISGQMLDRDGVVTQVIRRGAEVATIPSHGSWPDFTPNVELQSAGEREIRTGLVLPSDHRPDDGPLPVLMSPYGGPHAQRVRAARRGFLESQWLADQGFAVIIADGRGTPLRGPAWERSVRGDLLTYALEDQIAALAAVAERRPGLIDTSRVGIRGWSFGGYLAAAAVLRHPDVFHAAVAGAPVTDQRLYDTHYKERYLGHPDKEPENYDRCSLIPDAPKLVRPLMLIHGLADDNVLVAHTLQLSSALLAAGRPHTVLPLSGVTHMTPQEVVAENLLHLQIEFLRTSLGGVQ